MTSKPKAYSYIRFSSPEQARGDSRRRQSAAAIEYAKEHGLELVKDAEYAFADLGVSAYRGDHVNRLSSNLGRFYEYVKAGKIEPGSYLLVESLDRLSREQVPEALSRFLLLLNADIIVVTFGDGTVYKKSSDSIQLIMSIIHMGRAHQESHWKGSRVSDAWQEKQALARSEGKPLGAACPQWLKYDGEKYQVIPERVEVVKRVFQLTIQGYGQRAIVKLFNNEGVPVFGTKNRNKSGLWGNSSIAKILGNRSVLGEYQPNIWKDNKRAPSGNVIEGYYPSVIDQDIFYAAWNERKVRDVSGVTNQSANFNVWSKIAICSYCGSAMHLVNKGKPPQGQKYLRCSKSSKGACDNKSIRLDQSELIFKEMLAKINLIGVVKNDVVALRNNIAELSGRISATSSKLQDLNDLIKEYPSASLAQSIKEVDSQIQTFIAERDRLTGLVAAQHVIDKAQFMADLDLKTYEGRYLANQQVRRQQIKVRMKRDEVRIQFNVQSNSIPKLAFVWDHGKDWMIVPLSGESLRASIRQNDMAKTALIERLPKLMESVRLDESMQPYLENLSPEGQQYKTDYKLSERDAERVQAATDRWLASLNQNSPTSENDEALLLGGEDPKLA